MAGAPTILAKLFFNEEHMPKIASVANSIIHFDPLTTGPNHIRVFHFSWAHQVPPFKRQRPLTIGL